MPLGFELAVVVFGIWFGFGFGFGLRFKFGFGFKFGFRFGFIGRGDILSCIGCAYVL